MGVSRQGAWITCLTASGFRTHKDISSLQSRCLAVPGWYVPGWYVPCPYLAIAPSRSSFSGSSFTSFMGSHPQTTSRARWQNKTAKKTATFFQLNKSVSELSLQHVIFPSKMEGQVHRDTLFKRQVGL